MNSEEREGQLTPSRLTNPETEEATPTDEYDSVVSALRLFHDQFGQGHIFFEGKCLKIESLGTRKLLAYLAYQRSGRVPSSEIINKMIALLDVRATHENEQVSLENRIAKLGQNILYDLGNHQSIQINQAGWKVIDSPPKFRRLSHQQIQITPQNTGNVWRLFDFINVSEEHRLLVLVTLISYFIPGIPHPIFHPWGSQGSGKTSLFRAFKKIVDPSSVETLMTSNDRERMRHSLVTHYLPLFDNLSGIKSEISDMLCQACTGGGVEQRKLYTDDESVIFQIHRCIGINGINLSAVKPDLLDRTILLHLERIDPKHRREEADLWAEFDRMRPEILGGIFNIVSGAMRVYPEVKLTTLPRLADFGRWGFAIAETIGWGKGQKFLDAYQRNISQQMEEIIQSSTLASTLISYMESRHRWETTVRDAYSVLRLDADPGRNDLSFPAAPKELLRHLERLKATLAQVGLYFEKGKRVASGVPVTFYWDKDASSASSATSNPFQSEANEANEANSASCTVNEDNIPDFDV